MIYNKHTGCLTQKLKKFSIEKLIISVPLRTFKYDLNESGFPFNT